MARMFWNEARNSAFAMKRKGIYDKGFAIRMPITGSSVTRFFSCFPPDLSGNSTFILIHSCGFGQPYKENGARRNAFIWSERP